MVHTQHGTRVQTGLGPSKTPRSRTELTSRYQTLNRLKPPRGPLQLPFWCWWGLHVAIRRGRRVQGLKAQAPQSDYPSLCPTSAAHCLCDLPQPNEPLCSTAPSTAQGRESRHLPPRTVNGKYTCAGTPHTLTELQPLRMNSQLPSHLPAPALTPAAARGILVKPGLHRGPTPTDHPQWSPLW